MEKTSRVERIPGCTGKVPYFTIGEARSIVQRFSSINGKNMDVYHCKHLFEGQEHWHVTSMTNKTYKANKRLYVKSTSNHQE